MAAGPGGDPQGVLRLVSEADTAATVAIHAIDDAGVRTGPATLTYSLSPEVPGLVVVSASVSDSSPSAGASFTLSATVRNQGDGDGDCVEVNDVVELGEGESCTISQALVDKYSLNRVSIRAGDTASCSGGRVRLSFFDARTVQLNGLTIRCR